MFVSCFEAEATCDLIVEFSELQRLMFSSTGRESLEFVIGILEI